jgi:hypothetical protein
MREIHFFGLREDLLAVLEDVELKAPLKYVETGNRTASDFRTFTKGSDLPEVGIANSDSSAACRSYLVVRAEQSVNIRTMDGNDGRRRYLVDQLINNDAVTFTPAGLREELVVLAGHVGTAWDTVESKLLMKHFRSAISKRFARVKAFWVGPAARSILTSGGRLTMSVASPPLYDLKPD